MERTELTIEFKKWQKIHQFHNTRKSINEYIDYLRAHGQDVAFPVVRYQGKVKLDGTNAAIRVVAGQVAAQSRSRMLTLENDNYGFATFVDSVSSWAANVGDTVDTTIYGEWCGTGIQRRCSVSKCERMFVVFAAQIGDQRIAMPELLSALLGDLPVNVHVLPWHEASIEVDYGSEASIDAAINEMCERVERVELCDPWVKEMFGHEGMGEGLVYYPVHIANSDALNEDFDLLFKAKGEKHKNVIQLKPVLKDPEVVASIEAFVAKFVTDNRLQQGLAELGLSPPTVQDTGVFMKWLGGDVKSESVDELEAASLSWNMVAKKVNQRARTWFFAQASRR